MSKHASSNSASRTETLADKVTRLQKEYSACDDFPTARHEIKAELDAVREQLLKQPAFSAVTQVMAASETLADKVTRLQKEYIACDDFPTARHELKAELDAAREALQNLQGPDAATSPTP